MALISSPAFCGYTRFEKNSCCTLRFDNRLGPYYFEVGQYAGSDGVSQVVTIGEGWGSAATARIGDLYTGDPQFPGCLKCLVDKPTTNDGGGGRWIETKTLEFFFKRGTASNTVLRLYESSSYNPVGEYSFTVNCEIDLHAMDGDGSIQVSVTHDDSGDKQEGTFSNSCASNINDGNWHHICLIDDTGGTWRLYVDGVLGCEIVVGGNPHNLWIAYAPGQMPYSDSSDSYAGTQAQYTTYGSTGQYHLIANMRMSVGHPYGTAPASFTPPPVGIMFPRARMNHSGTY